MMDWICGNKFKDMADFAYFPEIRLQDDYYKFPNTFEFSKLKDCNIVFTTPFYVNQLFNIIKDIDKKFIIITHNGDNIINEEGIATLNGGGIVIRNDHFVVPLNVIRWFTPNVNLFHSKIVSIPIGIENDIWFPHIRKTQKMIDKLNEGKKYRNLVYMNHNVNTNPEERQILYDLFENKPWVDAQRFVNGYDFGGYIDNIYNHKFIICPRGNGLDTHRTWETLYMHSIPIEKRNKNNRFYYNFPILFVDDWDELTEDFLESQYNRLTNLDYWNGEQLTFEYWKERIRNDRR